MPTLSVITPVFNEAANLPVYKQRVLSALSDLRIDFEIVLVDDHSTDGSPEFIRQWHSLDPRVHYLRLSRNCGAHAACNAGLRHCTGRCAVFLAADLQDPPEVIGRLVEQWRQGYHVVWAKRKDRHVDRWLDRLTGFAFYVLMRCLVLSEMHRMGADVVLLDRKAIDAYDSMPEKNSNGIALILWMGFRQTTIECARDPRHAGNSKWSLAKKIKLFLDSIISFSYAPIRLISFSGSMVAGIGLFYALVVMVRAAGGHSIEGWSALMIVVLLLGGFQLLMLGILGEYLWRCLDESRGRPSYLIEEHLPSSVSLGSADASAEPSDGETMPKTAVHGDER